MHKLPESDWWVNVSGYVNTVTTFTYYLTLCMLQAVFVTFDELSLEPHPVCRYDSVSLYDGSSANSSSLGRFCRPTVAMSTITSSNSSLLVIFQTDNSSNKGRFSLSWTFGWFIRIQNISDDVHCRVVVQITTINIIVL